MALTEVTIALLYLGMNTGLLGPGRLDAQGAPAPMLPAAKITSQNPLGLTVDHAAISVMDLDKVAAFYWNILGFEEVQRGSWGPDVKFRALAIPGVFRIDLVQHTGSARHSPIGKFDMEQGLLHVCFKTADLDAAYKQVVSKNANVRLTKNQQGAITEMFLIDPEGNEVEIQR